MAIAKKNSNEEGKALSLELQKELERLKKALDKIEKNIGVIQTGESWNGVNAYEINKSLSGHLDHDKTLLSKLEKCSEALESAIK